MIEPYVVGEHGEQPGHTFLNDPDLFGAEHEKMSEFVDKRHQAAQEFLLKNKP